MKTSTIFFATDLHTLKFGDGDSLSSEVQILKAGTFNHPKAGRIPITPEVLKTFKANFDQRVRGIDIQVNFAHSASVAHGEIAAGWIKNLTLKNDGQELWATVDWTERAAKEIKASEWKYTSVEINFAWENPESGKKFSVLEGLALTNKPFIKGMQQVAASETQDTEEPPMKLSEIKGLLLSEHAVNLDEIQAKAQKADTLTAENVQLSERATAAEGKVKTLTTEVAGLTQKVELSEKAADKVKFDALVKKGMEEGKLTKAFGEGRLAKMFADHGYQFCEDLVTDLPKTIDMSETKGSGAAAEKSDFSDAGAEVARLADEKVTKSGGKLEFSEAVSMVLREDAKLAKAYEAHGV